MRNSKGFTPILIILVLALAIPAGYFAFKAYKPNVQPTTQPTPSTTPSATSQSNKILRISASPSPESTVCGDIPNNIDIQKDNFTIVKGPKWAPDCVHIAWSSWQSTFANPSIPVGLFLYDPLTKISKRVYVPKQGQDEEDIELQYWQNNNSIVFIKDGQRVLYVYDLTTDNSNLLNKTK